MNALHLSSRWGHSKTAQTLIDLGMNVETVNAVRFFPIARAISHACALIECLWVRRKEKPHYYSPVNSIIRGWSRLCCRRERILMSKTARATRRCTWQLGATTSK